MIPLAVLKRRTTLNAFNIDGNSCNRMIPLAVLKQGRASRLSDLLQLQPDDTACGIETSHRFSASVAASRSWLQPDDTACGIETNNLSGLHQQ